MTPIAMWGAIHEYIATQDRLRRRRASGELMNADYIDAIEAAASNIDAIFAQMQASGAPSAPPECKSEAEKTAFAFGWWKAMEAKPAGMHLKRETCGGKQIGHICPEQGNACRYPECVDAAVEPSAVRMLTDADQAALQRLNETFEDSEGWDIAKQQMTRLADLGAVRWHGASRYSITAFGRMALGCDFARWPLETVDECNARLAAANNLTVKD